jgi:DNA-binding transcriptional MerR regulator
MSNVLNEKMKSAEIADKLGIETVTLRKYCLVLESNGYMVQRNGKNREFTSDDLEVLAQMKYLIEKIGMDREQAAKIIVTKIKSDENDVKSNLPSTNVTAENPYEIDVLEKIERYEEQQNDIHRNVLHLTELMKALQEQSVAQEKKMIVEQKQAALNIQITLRRLEYKLREEAEDLWNQKSEEERFQRIGFLRRKIERLEEKERFIKKYIAENLEERINE